MCLGKESTCQCRDMGVAGLTPVSERSPREGNGNLLQYSCLENSMDRGSWQATVNGVSKSQTRLSTYACTHAHLSLQAPTSVFLCLECTKLLPFLGAFTLAVLLPGFPSWCLYQDIPTQHSSLCSRLNTPAQGGGLGPPGSMPSTFSSPARFFSFVYHSPLP